LARSSVRVESITDPEGSAILGVARCAHRRRHRRHAYWSNVAGTCIAPDWASASAIQTRTHRGVRAGAPYGLTDRERLVLRLVAAGRSNGEIGVELFIRRDARRALRAAIVCARSRASLAAWAPAGVA
jgi:DNA-binding CsgD family transcriptional regulator